MTTKLHDGLKAQWKGELLDTVGTAFTIFTACLLSMRSDATAHDFGTAVENFLDAVGKDDTELPRAYNAEDRPLTDDTRPLYQRIDDEAPAIAKAIKSQLDKLQLTAAFIIDDEISADFYAALGALHKTLGLPSVDELKDNPEAYPQVGLGRVNAVIAAMKGPQSAKDDDYKFKFAG